MWSVWSSCSNPELANPTDSTKILAFNSYDRNVNDRFTYNTRFDFTGYSSLELSFLMSHDRGYYTYIEEGVQWQYRTGILPADWKNIGSKKIRYQPAIAHWDTETVDFSELAGKTGVQIGLMGISEYGKNIFIDNISLTGTSPAAVPEASTLIGFGSALAMAGPGMIGWLRRRRA